MDDRLRKMERVTKLWLVVAKNPLRYTVPELAGKFETTVRTVYRDIRMLDNLGIPLYSDKGKWAINESSYLPPVRFSTSEALTLFLAARLMLGYSHCYDPNVESAFIKLNTVVPTPLGEQIQQTMDWMEKLPKNEKYLCNLAKLADAWISRHRIKIKYRSLGAREPKEHLIEPYFIQPAAAGHSSYVIAHSDRSTESLTFKVERIEDIQETSETYRIPDDFNANTYLNPAWGISVEGEAKTVKLRFSPNVARIIGESIWHSSQVLEKQKNGYLLMTLKVMDTIEFLSWILSWGENVEVLEPPEIRQSAIETIESMNEVYKKINKC
jgi:predicted DNA-binding transcriptional regulator YafY